MSIVVKADGLSKAYQLGQFSTGTLTKDLERWWALARGKDDPFLKIGEANDRAIKGSSNVVWSLRDVDLAVSQGESVGIIGKNGAGKSTLLKILSRVTTPTLGSVKIKGRVASLLEVGTGFHPELTGRENVFLNGAILGMSKREISRKFEEIVDFSGVERYIDTPVKRYSSGMYVRLAFAVAAHLESEILIVDEVLAVGDAEFQKKCLGKMGQVSRKEGRTILFVSHNLQSIRQLCPTSILLSRGTIQQVGASESVINSYLNAESSLSFKVDLPGNLAHVSTSLSIDGVRILDSDRREIEFFFISRRYLVEIAFEVKIATRVQLSLILSSGDGVTIFGSLNNHEPNFYDKILHPGRYRSLVEIPANLLNEGNYAISLSSFIEAGDNFNLENLLRFDTTDDGVLKKDFLGGFGGVIRPKLEWLTEKCDENVQ